MTRDELFTQIIESLKKSPIIKGKEVDTGIDIVHLGGMNALEINHIANHVLDDLWKHLSAESESVEGMFDPDNNQSDVFAIEIEEIEEDTNG